METSNIDILKRVSKKAINSGYSLPDNLKENLNTSEEETKVMNYDEVKSYWRNYIMNRFFLKN